MKESYVYVVYECGGVLDISGSTIDTFYYEEGYVWGVYKTREGAEKRRNRLTSDWHVAILKMRVKG